MKIAMCLEPRINAKWHHGVQIGVTDAVLLGGPVNLWDPLEVARVKRLYNDFGYSVTVSEASMPMDAIIQGTEERDAQMEQLLNGFRQMGAAGIDVYCYSWMTKYNWVRTSVTTRARGGALTTSYEDEFSVQSPQFKGEPIITRKKLWETLDWFLERALPVCEREGVKLAMHPDDPPIKRVFDVERIMNSVESFDRLLGMSSSKANGITMCQANFAAMGEDVPATIRHFGEDGRVHYAHFRDIRGDAHNIVETFHDEGMTDMYAAINAYMDIGYEGLMRPDHAPVLYGEPNEFPGYESLGRIFAVGYMKGLIEAAQKERAGA